METPILIDFWAPWCAPCKKMLPHVEALAEKLQGRIELQKVNVDEQPELALQYGVRSIPTLVLMTPAADLLQPDQTHGLTEKLRIVGGRSAADLEREVLEALK